MKILVPPGIGDVVWALTKVQSLAGQRTARRVELCVACWNVEGDESRALDFVRRFNFVTAAEMYVMPRLVNAGPCCLPGPQSDDAGINRYISDENRPGLTDIDVVMIPNRHLEEGKRLESWMPHLETNWEVMNTFQFTTQEAAAAECVLRNIGPFAVFFMASLAGNTIGGHNRGPIWTPDQWADLGAKIHKRFGLQILVVGASWDRDYYQSLVEPIVRSSGYWFSSIGDWSIGMAYAAIKQSQMVCSYQSGIGIVANYLRIPTVIWWRAKGDSVSPHCYVSYEESMASAWARPGDVESGILLPCIYGRETVDQIVDHAVAHGW